VQFAQAGLSEKIATQIASSRISYISLNIIEVATQYHFDLEKTAHLYFAVGERFNLVWFRDHIMHDVREGLWNALARLTLRDKLDILQKTLTVGILKLNKKEQDVSTLMASWTEKYASVLARWEKTMRALHESASIDYSMFFIVLQKLGSLIAESE